LEHKDGFLQHCLQPGFQKIRYYGILSTRNRKAKLDTLQQSPDYQPPKATIDPKTVVLLQVNASLFSIRL